MTNQTTNGTEELERRLNQLLDDYDNRLRLGVSASPISSFEQYSTLSKDELDKYSPENCDEAALELMQYSIFLQREINRERARLNWCDAYIHNAIASQWNSYDKYIPKEIRIPMIADENPVLKTVLRLKAKITSLINSTDNLPHLVKHYADLFSGYARSKRWTSTS
jgi:hypothetical protein